MNEDKNLLQILDQSACLGKNQLLGYLNHSLYPEELRVVELHLSSCALCSDALEGLETVQQAEALLASIKPPVLPAIVLPEKPVEKKEPPVIKADQPALSHPKGRHAKAAVPSETATENNFLPQRRKAGWRRPLGIAAALVIAAAAFWYFRLEKKNTVTPEQIAMKDSAAEPAVPQPAPLAAERITPQDSMQKAALLRKQKDSLLLAQRKAEKLKAQKDSLLALAAKTPDSALPAASGEPLAAAKESAKVAAEPAAAVSKTEEPASALAKKKEDSKAAASDYELGMQQYKDNNFASALLYFRTAESDEKNPKHWEAVYYSGMCNKSLNKKRKAVKYFERVVDAKVGLSKAAQKQLDNLKEQ